MITNLKVKLVFIFFNLIFCLDINADIGEDAIRSYLESAEKMRQLIVVRSKNCAGYKWRVTWQTGGSKPRIQIVSS